MSRSISTFYADDNKGKAVVSYNAKEEAFEIDYFDANNKHFFYESYPNKSIRYVEDAAENWALGIKKLEETENGF